MTVITGTADTPAARLRAKALARIQEPLELRFVLDDDLRQEILEFQSQLDVLEKQKESMARNRALDEARDDDREPESLGDDDPAPSAQDLEIDRLIAECRQAVLDIQAEAEEADAVLVTRWHRLAPARYDAEVRKAERAAVEEHKKDQTRDVSAHFVAKLHEALRPLCYVDSRTVDGEDVGLSLDELCEGSLTHAEVQICGQFCVNINRAAATVDFLHASSGPRARG